MTGLYGSSDEKDIYTAEALAALSPDTVRIYPTVVLKGTRLSALYEAGVYIPPTLGQSVSLCAKLLTFFFEKNIPVIRLGLHAGADVEAQYAAGPYHPAFRELCENGIYQEKIAALLSPLPPGAYTLFVAPGHASRAAGQKRSNLHFFQTNGYRLKICETPGVCPFQPQVDN